MEVYAEVTCVLKVKSNCQACKMKTMEILGSVCGMYSIDINSEEGLVRLQAVVEPNLFLKALAGTGPHAEPKSVKINHPKIYNTYNNGYNTYENGCYTYSNGYNALSSSNRGRALPDQPYRTMEPPHPHCNGSNPYYHGSNSNYHGSGPPQQRRRGPFHY